MGSTEWGIRSLMQEVLRTCPSYTHFLGRFVVYIFKNINDMFVGNMW